MIPMTAMRYNPVPYHSRPLATNLLSNFLLGARGGTGNIVMTSHPLVFTTELSSSGIQESDINVPAMQYMVIMSIAMALLLGIFIIFPLKERVTNAKQVQLMAGVNPFVFWFTNFAWDFIVYFGIALVYAVLIYIFDTRMIFHTNGGFGAFVFVLLMLGFVGLPWAYIMSFPFQSAPCAYALPSNQLNQACQLISQLNLAGNFDNSSL